MAVEPCREDEITLSYRKPFPEKIIILDDFDRKTTQYSHLVCQIMVRGSLQDRHHHSVRGERAIFDQVQQERQNPIPNLILMRHEDKLPAPRSRPRASQSAEEGVIHRQSYVRSLRRPLDGRMTFLITKVGMIKISEYNSKNFPGFFSKRLNT